MTKKNSGSNIYGVYLSQGFDLKSDYGAVFAAEADDVLLSRPEDMETPERIRFALCWEPAPDAFDSYPALELVIAAGAGVDRLLAHPGLRPEMKVARIRDTQQAYQMAGFAAHEVLHYEREFDHLRANAKARLWTDVLGRSPGSVSVALLGHGTMGQAVVKSLTALGFTLRVASRSAPADPLPGVRYFSGDTAAAKAATGADYLINLLPLTKATEGVLNADLFARLAPGARLIQIGRGEHLVEDDLIAALDSGQIAAASLDVFRQEPLPADHPFWAHPNLRLTPHLASHTLPEELVRQVIACARALRDGETCDSIVDPARGY
ncbi:MAG: hydroxyacid dehydrogenase [Rhodobacteraceae bacterium]|nr:hydroxyacid dehydrogenase [Paracoccaceae bacterium]